MATRNRSVIVKVPVEAPFSTIAPFNPESTADSSETNWTLSVASSLLSKAARASETDYSELNPLIVTLEAASLPWVVKA